MIKKLTKKEAFELHFSAKIFTKAILIILLPYLMSSCTCTRKTQLQSRSLSTQQEPQKNEDPEVTQLGQPQEAKEGGTTQVVVYGSIIQESKTGISLADFDPAVSAYFILGEYGTKGDGTLVSLLNHRMNQFAAGKKFSSIQEVNVITPPLSNHGQIFGAYVPMGYEASFSVKTTPACKDTPQIEDYSNSYLYSDCNSIGYVITTKDTVFPPLADPSTEDRKLPYNGFIFGGNYSLTSVRDHTFHTDTMIPPLKSNNCTTVTWYFKKCTDQPEFKNQDLKEIPSLTSNQSEVITQSTNPTLELNTKSSTGTNIGAKINIARSYGGIPVELSIYDNKNKKYQQIIRNGAPTDDALQLTIPTDPVEGHFYSYENELLNTATNQGAGDVMKNETGLRYFWGLESDLSIPVNRGNFVGWSRTETQKLKWTPLYTDFTHKSNGYGGTSPLLGVRAISLWDSRWEELSISKNDQIPTILRIRLAQRYRKSFPFQISDVNSSIRPQLWFSQLFYPGSGAKISAIFEKGSANRIVTHIPKPASNCSYSTELQGDSTRPYPFYAASLDLNLLIKNYIPNIPTADENYFPYPDCLNPYRAGSTFLWGSHYQLCGSEDHPGIRCQRENPERSIGNCHCWHNPQNRFRRIIFDYKNWGIAVVLVPGEGEKGLSFQSKNANKPPSERLFYGKIGSITLSNFSATGGTLRFVGGAQSFQGIPNSSFVDDYELYIGTIDDLEKAGLGFSVN